VLLLNELISASFLQCFI